MNGGGQAPDVSYVQKKDAQGANIHVLKIGDLSIVDRGTHGAENGAGLGPFVRRARADRRERRRSARRRGERSRRRVLARLRLAIDPKPVKPFFENVGNTIDEKVVQPAKKFFENAGNAIKRFFGG